MGVRYTRILFCLLCPSSSSSPPPLSSSQSHQPTPLPPSFETSSNAARNRWYSSRVLPPPAHAPHPSPPFPSPPASRFPVYLVALDARDVRRQSHEHHIGGKDNRAEPSPGRRRDLRYVRLFFLLGQLDVGLRRAAGTSPSHFRHYPPLTPSSNSCGCVLRLSAVVLASFRLSSSCHEADRRLPTRRFFAAVSLRFNCDEPPTPAHGPAASSLLTRWLHWPGLLPALPGRHANVQHEGDTSLAATNASVTSRVSSLSSRRQAHCSRLVSTASSRPQLPC